MVSYKSFDTWGDGSSSAALVAHLNGIPRGRIVCMAVLVSFNSIYGTQNISMHVLQDEGSSQLSASARNTISALGSKQICELNS